MSASARRSVLSLYRRCLRSAERIPSPDQRSVYLTYVKDGFRRGRRYVEDSRLAAEAVRDAEEQLERMDYYHSVRVAKEKVEGDGVGGFAGSVNTHCSSEEKKEDVEGISTAATVTTISDGRRAKSDGGGSDSSSGASNRRSSEGRDERLCSVRQWIASAVPHLRDDDVDTYASALVRDGFDSVGMIESELGREEDDLAFMKKAHRRSVLRALALIRGVNKGET